MRRTQHGVVYVVVVSLRVCVVGLVVVVAFLLSSFGENTQTIYNTHTTLSMAFKTFMIIIIAQKSRRRKRERKEKKKRIPVPPSPTKTSLNVGTSPTPACVVFAAMVCDSLTLVVRFSDSITRRKSARKKGF